MSVQAPPAAATRPTVTWRTVAALAALTAVSVLPYLAGVLVPYYVNDLDDLPLAEVASGAHDPKDLWPQGFVGDWVQLGGFLSLALTPIGLFLTLGVCGTTLVSGWPGRGSRQVSPGVAGGLALVMVIGVAALGVLFSPLGEALATWRMD